MKRLRNWADIEALSGADALTAAEKSLIAACRAGEECVLGDGSRPEVPDPLRNIRAELLRYLILGGCDACKVSEEGVLVRGAYVTDGLDISFATARGATWMLQCSFAEDFFALQSQLQSLNLAGSRMPSLSGESLQIAGSLSLSRTLIAAVNIPGASIGGQFRCDAARFGGRGKIALNAPSMRLRGDLILSDKFLATKEVSIGGSIIGGQLYCIGGKFINFDGTSINAQNVIVEGDVLLSNGFRSVGTIMLAGASIGGQLNCSGSRIRNSRGDSLQAQRMRVKEDVVLSNFHARGAVSFSGAQVDGRFNCDNGRFSNVGGDAINAQGARFAGGVSLCNGFRAMGEVSFAFAEVRGQFSCAGGRFINSNNLALDIQSSNIVGDLLLGSKFHAVGEVFLGGAKIAGTISLNGGKFENTGIYLINAQRMSAVSIIWRGVDFGTGRIDLTAAKTGDLIDDLPSWPMGGQVFLDGFTYDRITGNAPITAEARLKWLERCNRIGQNFLPQPYTQLAKVLREMGHDRAAQDVLVEQGTLIRQHSRKRAFMRSTANGNKFAKAWAWIPRSVLAFWNSLERGVVGYGYKPFRSLGVLTGLVVIAITLSHLAWEAGDFAPNSDVILTSPKWVELAEDEDVPNPAVAWSAKDSPGRDWETFNRYAYGFDVVVPILSLGQTEAWAPSTSRGIWGWALWWARWLLSSAGWVVTALAAAAVTGIIRRA
jgi:hypothetical protein